MQKYDTNNQKLKAFLYSNTKEKLKNRNIENLEPSINGLFVQNRLNIVDDTTIWIFIFLNPLLNKDLMGHREDYGLIF